MKWVSEADEDGDRLEAEHYGEDEFLILRVRNDDEHSAQAAMFLSEIGASGLVETLVRWINRPKGRQPMTVTEALHLWSLIEKAGTAAELADDTLEDLHAWIGKNEIALPPAAWVDEEMKRRKLG